MDLDPKLLRYLLAIHKAGSFVRAAELLNISQPALSVAISRLEDVLETRLVDRGRHGARLNTSGEMLLRHANSVENTLDVARKEVSLHNQGIHGPLLIGGTPLAMVSIIPEVTALLIRRFPRLAVRIIEGVDDELLAMLRTHELDVVVSNIGLQPRSADISSTPLFEARTLAVVRPEHPLASHKQVSLFDMLHYTWVMPPTGGAFRQLIEAIFAAHGVPFPDNRIEAEQFATLKRIVKRSDAVMLLSDQIVRQELTERSLIGLPLKEDSAPRLFGLNILSHRQQNALGKAFIEIVHACRENFALVSTSDARQQRGRN